MLCSLNFSTEIQLGLVFIPHRARVDREARELFIYFIVKTKIFYWEPLLYLEPISLLWGDQFSITPILLNPVPEEFQFLTFYLDLTFSMLALQSEMKHTV